MSTQFEVFLLDLSLNCAQLQYPACSENPHTALPVQGSQKKFCLFVTNPAGVCNPSWHFSIVLVKCNYFDIIINKKQQQGKERCQI